MEYKDIPLCIDLHCHPSIKPFGRAEEFGNENSPDPKKKNSIWRYDPPSRLDKFINRSLGLTRFSQSNFTALSKGNVRVVLCALNPIEKQFFRSSLGTDRVADMIYNFVTGIGRYKINHIQECCDNYEEFCMEYRFYTQLDNEEVDLKSNGYKRYKIARNYDEVLDNLTHEGVISVVLTVEGAYVFDCNNEEPFNEDEILRKIDDVKHWEHVPFFITITHHFYNEMGGHSRSFPPFLSRYVDQKYGMNTGMTLLGRNVITRLLKKDPRRIYIDIKHMSRKFRIDYYHFLKYYPDKDIPIIVSHGCLNGYDSIYNCNNPMEDDNGVFCGGTCHFFDDEVVMIAKSKGIFGIQLDDRHLSSKAEKKKIKWYFRKKTKQAMIAGFVWNQVEHIAEILDRNGYDAWETAAIGSDFDGIVDPPNGYWTSEDMPRLYSKLKEHAERFASAGRNTMLQSRNRSRSVKEIMDNLFSENAKRFLEKYFV